MSVQKNATLSNRVSLAIAILVHLSTCGLGNSANILFYFGVSTYSHRIIAWPLVETLAARGHNVSFLSPFPIKDPHPSVTDLVPPELTELLAQLFENKSDNIRERFKGNNKMVWNTLPTIAFKSCELLLQSPTWQEWIAQSRYDLVIIDAMYGECGLGLAYKFKAKVIYFKTNTIYPWEFDAFGLPVEASWIPDVQNDYPQEMNFLTRVKNALHPLYNHWYHYWIYQWPLEDVLRKGLGIPNMPTIYDLQGHVSLILMNVHHSTDYARALSPMVVPIAGLISPVEVKPMSQNLKKFVDSVGDEGFVYVSFGSAAYVSKLDSEFQRRFYFAFGNSSTKFIWKYEAQAPDDLPSNVYTATWMPQVAILSHPKCRGFITHGGLGSIHEAIYYAVPIILMPLMADQDYNAERATRLGYGFTIEITTMTQQVLESGIRKLITDNEYKMKMTELSTSFKDRQHTPLETAIWWTEKILRSSEFELSLLRPNNRNQWWFVRRLLDVSLFLLFVTLSTVSFLLFLILKVIYTFSSQKQGKFKFIHENKKKKQKLKAT